MYKPVSECGKNDVVQFVENHKWCGCLGIINEVKQCGDDIRYMIGVPVPEQGTAYIFSMASAKEFEYVGIAVMVTKDEDESKEDLL